MNGFLDFIRRSFFALTVIGHYRELMVLFSRSEEIRISTLTFLRFEINFGVVVAIGDAAGDGGTCAIKWILWHRRDARRP